MTDLSRRSFLTSMAALAALPVVAWVPSSDSHRHTKTATYWIAAADSPRWMQHKANVVCTGDNDQEQINAVMRQIESDGSGSVVMAGGTYYIDGLYLPDCASECYIVGNRFIGDDRHGIRV